MRPLLAITMGDINGVGPEIIAKAFAQDALFEIATPIVVGSVSAYEAARAIAPHSPEPIPVESCAQAVDVTGRLPFLHDGVDVPLRRPGVRDPRAGAAAMQWLQHAVDLAREGAVDAIVTCPINKQGIHDAGYTCRGHTDFIAERTNAASYRMCLYARGILVVHISDHVPLAEAVRLVREPRIVESVRIAHDALQRMGLAAPRIAVAGLNPHAGEAGAFGSEEHDAIAPAVARCRAAGIDCTGPHSPDAVFRHALNGQFDAVIAMYHDQGHIPLKLVAMDEGVNVTLGIPIVRTSVDHGTAYDIAGTGAAREDSFIAAYRLAARMAAGTRKVAT